MLEDLEEEGKDDERADARKRAAERPPHPLAGERERDDGRTGRRPGGQTRLSPERGEIEECRRRGEA